MKTCKLKNKCHLCNHDRGIITSPTGNIHPGRIDCANCGQFLKWVSKANLAIAEEQGLVHNPVDGCPILQ